VGIRQKADGRRQKESNTEVEKGVIEADLVSKGETHMNAGVKLCFYPLAPLEMLFHNCWYITQFDSAVPSLFWNNPHCRTRATLSLAFCTHYFKIGNLSSLKGSKHLG
jgi:hypothetical protein